MSEKIKDKINYLYVLGAGVSWGIISLFLKPLLNGGFTQIQTVAVRCLIAAAVLGVIMLVSDRKAFKIAIKDLWCFFGTGIVSMMFFSISYFYSMTYNGVCIAVILLYTSPVFVMLFSRILFKEKITVLKITAIILTVIGCAFASGAGSAQSLTPLGFVLGICSGLGYALYSIFSRYALNRGYKSITISFYTFLICGVSCLPFANVIELSGLFNNGKSIFCALGIGIVCCVLPYMLYTKGLEKVENSKASVIVAVEPVVASVIGIAVYHENLTALKILGIVFVLSAVVICSKD